MDIVEIAKTRYSTKKFDANRRIPDQVMAQVKALLRLSPSSVNSQPWHFIITDSTEGKRRIAKAAQGPYIANESKILDGSHAIIFCAKTEMSDEYLDALVELESQDGRLKTDDAKIKSRAGREFYANLHRKELHDTACWMEKQVYLNMGALLLGAGALGLDAVPIEGIDPAVLDQEFDLVQQGYKALAVVVLGYHAEDDFNADLPKSRWPESKIITEI